MIKTILTIVGARPQFIKAAVIGRLIREIRTRDHSFPLREVLVHTGQHYDANMSDVFFEELEISHPQYHLGIGSFSHGKQTGKMLIRIEEVIQKEKPDWVMVYGDTNSTLSGALAASKLHVPVAHVEAGLRSFNRQMPEELNRVMTDHVSTLLCCPTETAVKNLHDEGLPNPRLPHIRVEFSGDVMYDAALFYGKKVAGRDTLKRLGVEPKKFILATIHRAENTDSAEVLNGILEAFDHIGKEHLPIIWPVHPRTRNFMTMNDHFRQEWLEKPRVNLRLIEPLGYLDMICAEKNARLIMTDSGGVQKEACFHGTSCVVLRTETEWVESVSDGGNIIAGPGRENIERAAKNLLEQPDGERMSLSAFGSGNAGKKILDLFLQGV
ncbi:MAG: UDP-N-acetylglucosamine 2-epimerase (non-hydrolyzing) [Candidatus Riflebacteria bacterium]|nr:UDP-N-acetylglucosamine 2-epimerase (non-hydrolyzing) [Candidatus Riflebacteria bacterium]